MYRGMLVAVTFTFHQVIDVLQLVKWLKIKGCSTVDAGSYRGQGRGYMYSIVVLAGEGQVYSTVRVYGGIVCIYDWVTLFTWYGHKNLANTVLTAAVSDLAL